MGIEKKKDDFSECKTSFYNVVSFIWLIKHYVFVLFCFVYMDINLACFIPSTIHRSYTV